MYVYYHISEIVSSFQFAIVGVFIERQIEIFVHKIKGEGHLKFFCKLSQCKTLYLL